MSVRRKKGFIKNAAAFTLIFALCCGILTAAAPDGSKLYASTIQEYEDKIAEIDKQNEILDGQISAIDSDISESKEKQDLVYQKLVATKDQVDYYNNLLYYKEEEIANKQDDIDELDRQIGVKENEIEQKKVEIADLEKQNEENLQQFGQIVRAMYITGGMDIASVIAESNDFYDLMVRAKMMGNISEQNDQFMKDLQASMADLKDKIASLQVDIQNLDADKQLMIEQKQILEQEKTDLEASRQEAQALSDQYNQDYNEYSQQISDFEQRQENLEYQKQINAQEAAQYEEMIQEEIRRLQQQSNQAYLEGEWIWPLDYKYTMITTYFGWDSWRNGNHSGIDVSGGGINGANIYASKGGTVIKAKSTYTPGYSYGKYVVIDHGDGYSTLYGHCSELYVYEGQTVNQGDVIAAVGSTGWSTGPHLHFEVRINGVAQDPFGYVNLP